MKRAPDTRNTPRPRTRCIAGGLGTVRTFRPGTSELLDEYVATDHERLDRPAVGGLFVLHHMKKPGDRGTS